MVTNSGMLTPNLDMHIFNMLTILWDVTANFISLTFRSNILPPFLRSINKPRKLQASTILSCVSRVTWLIIVDSRLDDWICLTSLLQSLSVITVHTCNSFWIPNPSLRSPALFSKARWFATESLLLLLLLLYICLVCRIGDTESNISAIRCQSNIATDSQSVCLGVEPRLGLMTRCFFLKWKLLSCPCGAPSLTRGRVCQLSVTTSPLFRKRLSTLLWEQCLSSRCSTTDCSSWSSRIRVSTMDTHVTLRIF
jgi:hypothetical protein